MVRLAIAQTWDGQPIPSADQVTLDLAAAGPERLRITVRAPYYGDPAPAGPPGPTIGLWDHEVVELFVVGAGGPPEAPPLYTEVELGPHGHQLVLRLRGVRRVAQKLLPLDYDASIVSSGGGDVWLGDALLDRGLLPPPPHRINAYAIHGQGLARRHLALHPVPGDAPDFHRLAYFGEVTLPGV